MVSPQITNMAIILVMTQLSKKLPWDNPETVTYVRGLYILSNVLIALIYFYVQAQITKKKDLRTLKYVEPAPMGSGEEPKLVTTTVHAYDKQQVHALWKSQLMGVAMMGLMHGYMKYTNPLLIQSIIPLKGALEGNLVKIHLWGKAAEGDLKRPFKAPAGLMAALQGNSEGVSTDSKTIKNAETSGRGGKKDE